MDINKHCYDNEDSRFVITTSEKDAVIDSYSLDNLLSMLIREMDNNSIACDKLMKICYNTGDSRRYIIHRALSNADFDMHWLSNGNGSKEYVGKFTTRLEKFLKKTYDIKLTPAVKANVGEFAKRLITPMLSVEVDFTKTLDWKDGDFGDEGSCFWGDRSGVLRRLQAGRVWAVRYYDERHYGKGRAWFLPGYLKPEYALAFNFYGNRHQEQFFALIAKHFSDVSGVKYTFESSYMSNCCENCNFWYNGDAYIILPESDVYEYERRTVCLDGADSNWVHSSAVPHLREYYDNKPGYGTCHECGCDLNSDEQCTCTGCGCSLSIYCPECGCYREDGECVCARSDCRCTLSIYNCSECGHRLDDNECCTNHNCSEYVEPEPEEEEEIETEIEDA